MMKIKQEMVVKHICPPSITYSKYNNAKRSIPPTELNDVHSDLHRWPVTSEINTVHPLNMVNMSAKFDE